MHTTAISFIEIYFASHVIFATIVLGALGLFLLYIAVRCFIDWVAGIRAKRAHHARLAKKAVMEHRLTERLKDDRKKAPCYVVPAMLFTALSESDITPARCAMGCVLILLPISVACFIRSFRAYRVESKRLYDAETAQLKAEREEQQRRAKDALASARIAQDIVDKQELTTLSNQLEKLTLSEAEIARIKAAADKTFPVKIATTEHPYRVFGLDSVTNDSFAMRDGTGEKRTYNGKDISVAHRIALSAHEWTWTQAEQEEMAVEILALQGQLAQLRASKTVCRVCGAGRSDAECETFFGWACAEIEAYARKIGPNCEVIFITGLKPGDDRVQVAPLSWSGDCTSTNLHDALKEALRCVHVTRTVQPPPTY